MYVIFPADQLISMTYGIAVPRFPQRPTLDNLREPQVPIGNRSFPIPDPLLLSSLPNSVIDTTTTTSANLSITLQQQQKQLEELQIQDKKHIIKNLSRQNSINPSIKDNKLQRKNSNKSKLLLQNNHQKQLTPNLQRSRQNSLKKKSSLVSVNIFENNNSTIHYNTEKNEQRMNDYLEEDYMRERSPSIFLEPPTLNPDNYQSRPPIHFSSNQSVQSNHSKSTPNSPKSVTSSSKSKLRPKLNISLGRLGRNQPDQSESIRSRDEIKLHVENPTFTKENLRQRNFDAFFEAGVSKYSIERTPNIVDDEYGGALSMGSGGSTFDGGGSGSHNTPNTNKSRLGLFSRGFHKTPVSTVRSRSADCDPARDNTADVPQKDFSTKSSTGAKGRSLFGWRGARSGSLGPPASMASYSGVLKDYGHSNLNETFKIHNGVTFKLVKTVSDFTDNLSHLYEDHATALQTLVSTYRKKNGELRKERPASHSSLFQAWETFLQEIEADSQASSDVASTLSRQVSRPMLDRSFHRKVQSRKIFTHRESFETIIAKTEDKLSKCRMDYKQSYMAHRQNPSQHTLTEYVDSHNAYVQQLHATNAMLESYHCETIPQLMQELEEIYNDLCSIVAEAVVQGAEIISSKAAEQSKRYNSLSTQCQTMSPQQDLTNFVRILPAIQQKVPKRAYAPPQQPQNEGDDITDDNSLPQLRNELVIDRHSSIQLRSALDLLKRESADLEIQIRQLQDSVDTLIRTQTRGIENQLYNKANELQEDLSMKKFDLRAKQLHLTALRAQKELFLPKSDPVSPQHGDKKFTPASTPSMKTKWMKAFRSLKPASGSSGQPDRRNGAAGNQPLRPNEDGSHNLSEYTYKKITPCDVCSQILRGHTRQGLRCRICKLNAHADCAPQLQATKCQAKQKLLRRQKSTSELENRVDVEEEKITDIDQIYRVLKQAGEIKSNIDKSAIKATAQQQQKNIDNIQTQPQQLQLNTQLQDNIPIVNVPECPERRTIPGPALLNRSGGNRGPTYKPPPPPTTIIGGGKSGGLTAPKIQDVSSSGLQQIIATTTTTSTTGTTISTGSGNETGLRRRLFAGFRPLSGFGRGRNRAPQHRSISLPETPHSPRRQKLNLRMKSLSLDSPESSELHGQMRRRQPTTGGGPSTSYYQGGGSGGQLEHTTPPSNNSRLHSPSSPSHQRKLLYANRGLKTGSVDLPDDIEKSLSSASTSPCPSPVRKFQKSHRLLPTNLYVILYNFKARHGDELDLKAGYKVTVIETSDPDWWKGKFLGRLGYFPSKYCARLNAGEKPLQVTHNLQVSDGERGENMNLLRDQIVIQVGEELNGMVLVRSAADNRQGYCPIKYLQEV